MTSTAVSPVSPGGVIDAFVLPAGGGLPELQVQLRWSTGADPTQGTLVLLDAAGTIVQQFSLAQVTELQVILSPMPLAGSSGNPILLSLDLKIWRAPDGSARAGSYDLTLQWIPVPGPPAASQTPPDLSLQPQIPPGGASTSPPSTPPFAPPGLLITGHLLPVASVPDGVPIASEPTSVPAPPHPPINPGGHPAPGPTGAIPIPVSSSTLMDRSAALVVGPLPLGRSIPDGGIFERSFTAIAPARSAPLGPRRIETRAMLTAEVPEVECPSDAAIDRVEPALARPERLWLVSRSGKLGSDRAPTTPPAGLPEVIDLEVGAVNLPPLPPLPVVIRGGLIKAREAEAGSLRPRGRWWNPVAATLFSFTSSAVIVLRWNRPPPLQPPKTRSAC